MTLVVTDETGDPGTTTAIVTVSAAQTVGTLAGVDDGLRHLRQILGS